MWERARPSRGGAAATRRRSRAARPTAASPRAGSRVARTALAAVGRDAGSRALRARPRPRSVSSVEQSSTTITSAGRAVWRPTLSRARRTIAGRLCAGTTTVTGSDSDPLAAARAGALAGAELGISRPSSNAQAVRGSMAPTMASSRLPLAAESPARARRRAPQAASPGQRAGGNEPGWRWSSQAAPAPMRARWRSSFPSVRRLECTTSARSRGSIPQPSSLRRKQMSASPPERTSSQNPPTCSKAARRMAQFAVCT